MSRPEHLIVTLLLALATVAGCAGNPATGGSNVVLSSAGGEVKIGEEMHQKMVEDGALYNDPALTAYVDKIGQRLVANSDMPDRKFTFHIIDSPDINAFATPGGYIYVNRGLLVYMDSEAELAGVLGHEIGHVTARHHGRRTTAAVTSNVLAATVYILTGSGDLADASNIYGAELISGYGREMELEADGLGARYMHSAGYDPEALLEVIGVLKNHEQYQRSAARAAGKGGGTYHGLYASHPRNDQRLKTVINTAAELDLDAYVEDPSVPGEFKRVTNGMVWGESIQGERDESRHYHNKLQFSFMVPEGWQVRSGSQAIVVSNQEGTATLSLTIGGRSAGNSPQETLEDSARGELNAGTQLDMPTLQGYSAIASADGVSKRLAVVDYKNLNYLFEGQATDFDAADPTLLAIIASFRPLLPGEKNVGPGQFVRYIQVPRGETMSSIAAGISIDDAENQLRLINGLYPSGEPRTGDWIKIVE